MDPNVISNVQSATHDRCREPGRLRTRWKCRIRWTEKIQFEYRTSSVTVHVTTREHAGRTRQQQRLLPQLRRCWLKHYDAMELLIMDQGTKFGADFQHLCQSRGILPVVTDLETPWQNAVVERHGALFNIAFEKACSLEAPTTEAERDELIDFTFSELNRRVGRAGFSFGQRDFWTTALTSFKLARGRFP